VVGSRPLRLSLKPFLLVRFLGTVWLCFLAFFAPLAGAWAQNVAQVAFQNTETTLLKDKAGAPLTKGGASDGDGALLQLGFYTNGSAANPFTGSFVPLTGAGAQNAAFRTTSIGDSGGGADGRFNLVFHFLETAQGSGQTLPTPGTPLVIRFFSTPALGNLTLYNEVSGAQAWAWQAPSLFPGTILFLSLLDTPLLWKDGPGSAFRTTLGLPPELLPPAPEPPSLSGLVEETTLSAGQPLELKVTATGSGPVTFQWSKDGALLAGGTGSALNLTALRLSDAGTYTVKATNASGSTVRSVVVRVVEPPALRTPLSNQTVSIGDAVSFLADVSGTPPLTFQWFKNGLPLPGATAAMLRIPVVGPGDLASYRVVVTGPAGTLASDSVSLLLRVPVTINLQPASQNANTGANVQLKVGASGSAPISYQWRRAGVPIPGATAAELPLAALQIKDAGLYDVIVSNSAGSLQSAPAILTVAGVTGSLISTQPRDVKTLRRSNATQSIVLAPESEQALSTTYQVHSVNGQSVGGAVLGLSGTVPKDGGLQLPLGGVTESGQYVVRFRRVFQTHTVEFDSLPFTVETKTWTNVASSYLALLQDADNALGDGAKYRGLVSLSITSSGGVSARLTYVEAPLIAGEPTRRAYSPVSRRFSGAFKAVPNAPSKFVFTSAKTGLRPRQELTVEMDCSSAPPQVSMTVRDHVSLNASTYTVKAAQCLPNADKSSLPTTVPSGRFLLQSKDRAQFQIRTTGTGNVIWTSRVGDVAGAGSTALRVNPDGLLGAPMCEVTAKNSATAFSTKAVFGSLNFTRPSGGQLWRAALGAPLEPGTLEYHRSQLQRKAGGLVWDPALATFNGVRSLQFAATGAFAWEPDSGSPWSQAAQFLLSAQDPSSDSATRAAYQWRVSFLSSGMAKTVPVGTAAGTPPPLTLRLDKLSGALSGSYFGPGDKTRRLLFGAGSLNGGFSAWGWTDNGTGLLPLSAEWSIVPAPAP
jgi:hypothetical protein